MIEYRAISYDTRGHAVFSESGNYCVDYVTEYVHLIDRKKYDGNQFEFSRREVLIPWVNGSTARKIAIDYLDSRGIKILGECIGFQVLLSDNFKTLVKE